LGLGLDTIESALKGESIPTAAFGLKAVFTAITLGFGGSGGIITPIFFVGASAGSTFGNMMGFDTALFSAIGMVALLAGAANTPISASIMAIELFGPAIAPYAAVACIISFLMTGHRSVYPSQILSLAKPSSLAVSKGSEMRDAKIVDFRPGHKSLSGIIAKSLEKWRSRNKDGM
jgi:H+/Cl- antiporter ClcA